MYGNFTSPDEYDCDLVWKTAIIPGEGYSTL